MISILLSLTLYIKHVFKQQHSCGSRRRQRRCATYKKVYTLLHLISAGAVRVSFISDYIVFDCNGCDGFHQDKQKETFSGNFIGALKSETSLTQQKNSLRLIRTCTVSKFFIYELLSKRFLFQLP